MDARVSFYKETKFKETQLGRIPEDWKTAKISKLFNLYKGTTPSTKIKEYWNGKIPFVTPTDITRVSNLNKIYLRETEKYITEKGLASKNLKLIPANSLLFTSRATIGYLAINDVKVTINQGVISLMPKDKDVEITFFYYLFQRLRSLFESLAGGSTYKEISMSTFSDIEVCLPSVLEQKTIAHILLTVDKAIQKTNEIIEKTRRLKNGLMQELLTKGIGHKEFKDTEIGKIPKEWDVIRLGDVAEFKNGINFTKEEKGDKGILTVDVLNMYGESIYLNMTDLYRVNIHLKDEEYLLKKGDILFVRSSLKREGAGWVSLFNGWKEPVTFCGFIIRARLRNKKILPEFLTYFLRSDLARKKLVASSGQVAITNITQGILKTLKFPFPRISEQQKIVKILLTIDKKLEIERKEKERLERIKQALMDLLLTGKVRVKVNEGA